MPAAIKWSNPAEMDSPPLIRFTARGAIPESRAVLPAVRISGASLLVALALDVRKPAQPLLEWPGAH